VNYRVILQFAVVSALAAGITQAQDSGAFMHEATQQYRFAADNLLKSAEQMPAADYAFRPTREAQSFGDWISDVATSHMEVCSAVLGQRPPADEGFPASNKADLIWALKKSMKTCDSAYASVNSFNASQQIVFEGAQHSKLGLLFLNASHDNEVYGNLSVYLRLKGIAPPSAKARLLPVSERRP
jgi:hypothetical protein